MVMFVRIRKIVFVGLMALAALGVLQGSASAAADGDLDISTLPPHAQARINPGLVVAQPGAIKIDPGFVKQVGP
jgi:hypothetical protein